MRNKKITLIFILWLVFSSSSLGAISDPTRLGLSARTLGMGKVSVAGAEDSSSIFNNPAGLTRLENPNFTSMYTNITEDLSYTSFAYANPAPLGSFGLGILRLSSPGVLQTSQDSTTGRGKIDSTFDYENSLYFLSYGKKINEKLAFGTTLKYLNQSFGTSGNLSNFNLDLGIQYRPSSRLTFGLLQRNLLSGSSQTEALESQTKLGINCQPKDNLTLGLDFDLRANRPLVFQTGLEWKPLKTFSLRAGIEEVALSSSTYVFNPSIGLGLELGGIGLDYAYYLDNSLDYNNSHFLSLSFKFLPYIPKGQSDPSLAKNIVVKQVEISSPLPLNHSLTAKKEIKKTKSVNKIAKSSKKISLTKKLTPKKKNLSFRKSKKTAKKNNSFKRNKPKNIVGDL